MKTIAMLILGACFAAFAPRPAAAQPGAPRATSVDDKDVVKAAQFAIEAQQKAMTDAGQTGKLTLVKIVSVKKQVVAGMNFLLTLQVKVGDEARTAEAKIWWQAWRKLPYQLTSWKFTGKTDHIMASSPLPSDGPRIAEESKIVDHLWAVESAHEAVSANNGFAVDLYRQLAKEKQGKNLFFSPYSMTSALAMTANGARGETAAEMGKVLCFPESARRGGDNTQPWNTAVIHAGMAAAERPFQSQARRGGNSRQDHRVAEGIGREPATREIVGTGQQLAAGK